jgi:hypothetical protein
MVRRLRSNLIAIRDTGIAALNRLRILLTFVLKAARHRLGAVLTGAEAVQRDKQR